MRFHKNGFVVLAAGLFLPAAVAYAASTSTDRTQTEQALQALDADSEHKSLVSEPSRQAREALKRASDARASADEKHAALLEALALEWAGTASDLVRSVELEKQVSAVEKEAIDTEAKAVRAVAIIEEAVARKGRAQDELNEQEQGPSAAVPAPREQQP